MAKAILFMLASLPTLLFAGGTITAGTGGGRIIAQRGAGDATMLIFNGYQPPGDFRFTAVSSNSLTTSWNAALNPSATGYTLQYSTASDFTGTILSSVTQALTGTIGSLSVNVLYYARIKSEYHGGINSVFSQTISTATLTVIPVAVASTWTVTTTSVGILWSRGDNPANTTLYQVQLSTVSDLASGTVYSSSTYFVSSTFTSLTAGNTYFAQVQSINLVSVPSSFLHLGSTKTNANTAPTLVQSSCMAAGLALVDPLTLTFNSAVTAGNNVVVVPNSSGFGHDLTSVSDSVGNTYTQRSTNGSGSARVSIYASTNVPTGGAFTVTFDMAGAGGFGEMCIAEFSGANVFSQQNSGTATDSSPTSGNITEAGQALWIGGLTHSTGGTITLTEDGTWTLIGEEENNSAGQALSMIYKVQGGATDDAAWTTGSAVTWFAVAATFTQ